MACPRFLPRGSAEVSGVRAGPQGRRVSDAQQRGARRGGPVPCAAHPGMSGGEAATTLLPRPGARVHAACPPSWLASQAAGEIIPIAECRRMVLYSSIRAAPRDRRVPPDGFVLIDPGRPPGPAPGTGGEALQGP